MTMTIKTITCAALACGMAFASLAQEKVVTLGEMFKAKDFASIAAYTNNYGAVSKNVRDAKANFSYTAADFEALGDAFRAAGEEGFFACKLYFLANNSEKYLESFKDFAGNGLTVKWSKRYVLPDLNWTWLRNPSGKVALKMLVDACLTWANDPAKAAKSPLGRVGAIVAVWNKAYPSEAVELVITEPAVVAYAVAGTGNLDHLAYTGNPALNNWFNMICIKNHTWAYDSNLASFAKKADHASGSRANIEFRKIALAKVKTCSVKAKLALVCKDSEALLDALATVQPTSFTAAELNQVILVINGKPTTWRAADVLAALKNINSMYTLKLYDDRDTWEPVLSKVRAMLDVRENN